MVDAPTLQRQKSTVPTSTCNVESTVLDKSAAALWPTFKAFKLEVLAPGKVESTSWTDGQAGTVGGLVEVVFKNGSKWTYQMTEISDKHRSLSYNVVFAEPAMEASSLEGDIQLFAVTDGDQTFVRWSTDFSNDADAEMVQDQKYKKMDMFAEIKKNL